MNVRRDVAANLIGRFWTALMGFAFVPFYLRHLGIEAYGLIGFFAAMMGVFAVLDLGLGITVNRELSRLSTQGGMGERTADLMRTFESVYWLVAVTIGATIALLAPLIVDRWLNLDTIPRVEAIAAVRMMGATAFLRWPMSIYVGAMMGLRQQARLNIVTSIAATIAGGGAVLILVGISPTLPAFFAWQTLIAGAQVLVLRRAVWRTIARPAYRPRVTMASVRETLSFSAGITGITLLSVILSQLDKFVLSRLLPLREFGFYALAGTIASVLIVAGSAVESAAFPALARHIARGDTVAERQLYHRASAGLAMLVVPIAATIAIFSPELLLAYTHDPQIVAGSHLVLSLLVIGNGVLALMFMPLALQLANGWTGLSLWKNVIAVLLFVPILLVMVPRFGATGAAATWIALTLAYLTIEIPVMHRRLLPGAARQWYLRDIGVPITASAGILGTLRLTLPAGLPLPVTIILVGLGWLVTIGIIGATIPEAREMLTRRLHALRQLRHPDQGGPSSHA